MSDVCGPHGCGGEDMTGKRPVFRMPPPPLPPSLPLFSLSNSLNYQSRGKRGRWGKQSISYRKECCVAKNRDNNRRRLPLRPRLPREPVGNPLIGSLTPSDTWAVRNRVWCKTGGPNGTVGLGCGCFRLRTAGSSAAQHHPFGGIFTTSEVQRGPMPADQHGERGKRGTWPEGCSGGARGRFLDIPPLQVSVPEGANDLGAGAASPADTMPNGRPHRCPAIDRKRYAQTAQAFDLSDNRTPIPCHATASKERQ